MLLEDIRQALLPFYMHIKFIHVIFMAVWFMSTAVAYTWFVQSAFYQAEKRPDDPEYQRKKAWALEQFDKGVVLEHIAFPILLITGPLMYWLSGWEISWNWLGVKLLIIIGIFIPMEIFDYWISHFGGNKTYLKEQGDQERYEKIVNWHWKFLRNSTPVVAIFIPVVIFLAVVKPF